MKRKTRKELEEENRWLWYNHIDTHVDAQTIEVIQRDKKGKLVQQSTIYLPAKKNRVKPPTKI